MSIRSRLAISYGAGVLLTLLIVGLFVWLEMGTALQSSLETTLRTRASGVLATVENVGQAGLQETDLLAPGVFAAMFSADGTLVDASADAPNGLRPTDGVFSAGGRQYLVRTQTAPDGSIVATGADLQPMSDSQAALARLLLGVGLSVGLASMLGGWFLAGRALRPVDRLIDDAEKLGPGDLERRLSPPARMDEVGRLTLTLNRMLDRIADSVERQRLFVAMASHELRTPLTALRAELEIADHADAGIGEYRDAVREAQGDALRLTSLATSLLELAAAHEDAGSIVRAPINLRRLATSVVRSAAPLARQRAAAVKLDVPDAVAWVDRTRIEHALGNLLSNALTYAGRAGEVEVHFRIDGEAGARELTVEVLDRGPGLGDDQPDDLFAPFQRGSHAYGPGSGLGLATVAGAIRAHGGRFGAGNRAGGGARFWFTVPCEPDEPPEPREAPAGRRLEAASSRSR